MVAAEEASERATAAGEMTTRMTGGNSSGRLIVSREAVQRGVRSPNRAVPRTQALRLADLPLTEMESRGGEGA